MNKVHLIDNMEFMKTIPDKYYELAIVDPPYRDQNQPTIEMRQARKAHKSNRFVKYLNIDSISQVIFLDTKGATE